MTNWISGFWGELRCSGRIISSCSNSRHRRVTLYEPCHKSFMGKCLLLSCGNVYISDDYSFEITTNTHDYIVCIGKGTNITFNSILYLFDENSGQSLTTSGFPQNVYSSIKYISWNVVCHENKIQYEILIEHGRGYPSTNIKVMKTGYLTVILSLECFIRGNLSIFCQKLHKRCQYLCY